MTIKEKDKLGCLFYVDMEEAQIPKTKGRPIIGVDPGLGLSTAVVLHGRCVQGVYCTRTSSGSDMLSRICLLYYWMGEVRGSWPWPPIAIEENYVGPNGQTALAQREAIAALCLGGDIYIRVSPAEAKKALTGKGNATKDEMVHAARERTDWTLVGTKAQNEGIADAIGVAMAGRMKL